MVPLWETMDTLTRGGVVALGRHHGVPVSTTDTLMAQTVLVCTCRPPTNGSGLDTDTEMPPVAVTPKSIAVMPDTGNVNVAVKVTTLPTTTVSCGPNDEENVGTGMARHIELPGPVPVVRLTKPLLHTPHTVDALSPHDRRSNAAQSGAPQLHTPGAMRSASVGQLSRQSAVPSPSVSKSETPQPHTPGSTLLASEGQPS